MVVQRGHHRHRVVIGKDTVFRLMIEYPWLAVYHLGGWNVLVCSARSDPAVAC